MASPVPGFLNSGDYGNYGNYGNLLSVSTTPAPSQISSTTPILDRLVPPPALSAKPNRETPRWIGYVIAIVAVFVPSLWIWLMMTSATVLHWSSAPLDRINRAIDPPVPYTELMLLWRFLAPMLALLAVTVVHELGHVIAGKLVGFQLVSAYFGRLQIIPPFHLRWHRTDPLPGAAAFIRHLPVHSEHLRLRAMAVYAAGPAANFACALAFFFLPPLGIFFIWFGAFSIMTAVFNLLPFRRRSLTFDGLRILRLLRNTGEQERALAIMQLSADLHSGTEPENLRPEFLALATAIQDNSVFTVYGHHFAYLAAYYKHDDVEAARLLEICLQYSSLAPAKVRESMFGCAVDFQASRRKRLDLARQWFADIPETPLTPGLRSHMEATILEAEGDLQGALKKLDEAETVIRQSPEANLRAALLRFFQRWRKELEAQLAAKA
jgi:Zn-dependent protease